MPRKLRLTQKKNFERKKSAAHKQLTVRIPTVILQKATIKNLVELQRRIDRYGVPKGWFEIADQRSSDSMFLTRLSEEQAIVIKIDHSLHWSVKCCGREVSCNEIEQACEKIASYDLMKSLLAKLRLYHPCSGIRCKDFNEVLYNNKETMITINGKLKKMKDYY